MIAPPTAEVFTTISVPEMTETLLITLMLMLELPQTMSNLMLELLLLQHAVDNLGQAYGTESRNTSRTISRAISGTTILSIGGEEDVIGLWR